MLRLRLWLLNTHFVDQIVTSLQTFDEGVDET